MLQEETEWYTATPLSGVAVPENLVSEDVFMVCIHTFSSPTVFHFEIIINPSFTVNIKFFKILMSPCKISSVLDLGCTAKRNTAYLLFLRKYLQHKQKNIVTKGAIVYDEQCHLLVGLFKNCSDI